MQRSSLPLIALTALMAFGGGSTAPAQEIPAIVALTLDTSGSISPQLLTQVKELAVGVLQSLPPSSQVALFTFDDASRKIQERTTDTAAVQAALEGVNRAGRYTALYDALYDASNYLKEAPPARKAIILITDGLDENSSVQIEDGLKLAVEGKIPVYCVGVGRIQEAVLRRIAKLTNGEYAPMDQTSAATLAAHIQELPVPAPSAAPAPVPAVVVPVAAVPARDNTGLYVIVGTLIVASAFGAAYLLRRRPEPAHRPRGSMATGLAAGAAETEPEEDGADRTVVMRSPDAAPVERTVMLRLQPRLTITRGVGEGQVFNLSAEASVSIGRAPNNDIPVTDNAVSGEHCRVRPEDGVFVLHDLKSTNGTFVNERRVERHRLSEGDLIRVGETQIQFSMGPG